MNRGHRGNAAGMVAYLSFVLMCVILWPMTIWFENLSGIQETSHWPFTKRMLYWTHAVYLSFTKS